MPPLRLFPIAPRVRAAATAVLGVVLLSSAATAALASGWSTPHLLNAGGNGFEASDAIDSNGNALVTWLQNLGNDNFDIQFAVHPNGGAWTKSQDLVPPSSELIVPDPVVHETAAGTATAVWWTTAGAFTADRPAGGSWTTPQLVLPGISGAPAFTMNSQGAAVLEWETGDCGIRGTGNCTIMTLSRPAGGAWGQPVSVETTSNRFRPDSIVIGEGGDAVTTWETYQASCTSRRCTSSNFILFAARLPSGTTNWQIARSSLAGPDPVSHIGAAALDMNNLAAVFVDSQTTGITAVTEPSGSQSFAAPVTVTNETDIALGGAQSDPSGDVTLVGLEGSAEQVVAISGNFDNNTWNSVDTLSTADTDISESSFPVAFAVGANGESVVAWAQASTMQSLNDNVVVSVSASPGASWSKPVAVATNAETGLPQSVSVNSSGQAVLSYSDLNATTNADEIQATVYTPKTSHRLR
jgi:hypothetical protein